LDIGAGITFFELHGPDTAHTTDREDSPYRDAPLSSGLHRVLMGIRPLKHHLNINTTLPPSTVHASSYSCN
jgi:hypothetical protein